MTNPFRQKISKDKSGIFKTVSTHKALGLGAYERTVSVSCIMAKAIAILGLLGYIPALKLLGRVHPGYVPMAISTAIFFLLLGGITPFAGRKHFPAFFVLPSLVVSGTIAAFGLLKCLEFLTGVQTSFETHFITVTETLGEIPLRIMSPLTGMSFLFAGISVFFLILGGKVKRLDRVFRNISGIMGALTLLTGLIVALGYFYGTPFLYKRGPVIPMALTTALAFICLGTGLIMAPGKNSYPITLITANTTRARFFRVFLPLMASTIIAYDVFRVLAFPQMNTAMSSAMLMGFFCIVVFFVLDGYSAHVGKTFDMSQKFIAETKVALGETEEKFKLLFENANDAIYIIDSETMSIVECNDKAVELDGYTVDELKGMTIQKLHPQEERALIPGKFKEIVKKGVVSGIFGFHHLRKDGKVIDIEVNSSMAYIGEKELNISIIRNVTERKKAEESLKRSAQLLNDTGEMAKVGGWEFDADTRRLVWTEEVYRIHEVEPGYNPDVARAIGFYAPEDKPIIEKAVKRAIEFGEPFDVELRLITAKGKHIWGHAVGKAYQKGGKVIKVGGTFQDITERKNLENILRENEAKYRSMIENSLDAILVADVDTGIIIEANRAAEKLLGIPVEKIIGMHQSKLHPEREQNKSFREHVRRGGGFALEGTVLDLQGREIPVEIAAFLIEVKGKKCMAGVFRDITARKEFEKSLMNSESRFRGVFEGTSSCVMVYEAKDGGEDFIIRDFNPAAEKTEKIKKEEIFGKSVGDVFPGIEGFGLLDVLKKVWKTGEPVHFPAGFYEDNRISGWRENFVYKLPTGEIVAIYDDLTEKKLAEQKIADLAKFPEEDPNPVIRIDKDGMLLYRNKPAARLFAREGCFCSEGCRVGEKWRDPSKTALSAGRVVNLELESGGEVFAFTVTPVAQHGYCNFYGTDITEKKRIERTKDTLLRDVSHTIKTPISNAKMAAGIIGHGIDAGDMEKVRMGYKILGDNVDKSLKDVMNILDMTFYLHESNIGVKEQSDLKEIIDGIFGGMAGNLSKKGLAADNLVPAGFMIYAAKHDLFILLGNMVENAVKFTDNGRITVEAEAVGPIAEIRISDTGQGMTDEVRQRVFEKFYKKTPATDGVGLGLSICKEIVARYKGHIDVISEGEGKGTTVVVKIPM